jgi:hypothetical protein
VEIDTNLGVLWWYQLSHASVIALCPSTGFIWYSVKVNELTVPGSLASISWDGHAGLVELTIVADLRYDRGCGDEASS